MHQAHLPVKVDPHEVARKQTLGAAIELCAELAGFGLDKELQQALGVDKAQFSRWQSGTEGVMWSKFERLMDVCGNDAPLFWMLHRRGYDLGSVRKVQSELERRICELEADNKALRRVMLGGAA